MIDLDLKVWTDQEIIDVPSVESVSKILTKQQYHVWLGKHRTVKFLLVCDVHGNLHYQDFTKDEGTTYHSQVNLALASFEEYRNEIRKARCAKAKDYNYNKPITDEQREANRLQSHKWRKLNREKYRKYQREYHKRWATENPEKIKQYKENYKNKQ